jgi:alpha-1,6-mannosyltransferase
MTAKGFTFCDVSSLYTPTGGGIRRYHDAKLEWFAGQRRHSYCLIVPGPRFSVTERGPNASIVTFYGAPMRAGYRLPLDVVGIRDYVARLRPDVLETGDPWISGPLGLWFRRLGYTNCLSSFYHSDPVATYVAPTERTAAVMRPVRRWLGRSVSRPLVRMQQRYDLTLTSSAWVGEMLKSRGISRILRVPFGVDRAFFDVGRARRTRRSRTRLLYVGRLQADKAIDLLIDAIPELLQLPRATLTVVGAGPAASKLRALSNPGLRLEGYVSSRERLAEIYADHDVLLAPGPFETFGIAALEGLASGLSLVAPDAGGTGELLRSLDRPHLFIRNDRADFVRAVREATAADATLEARAAVALAEQYGAWPHAIEREVESYCRFLSHCTT